jgi:hypothetical protein
LRANGSRERAPDDRLREAIHLAAQRKMDCFVASLLAMTYDSAFSRRDGARVLPETLSLEKRGSRECRVHAAPAVSCAKCTRKNAHEHTGSAEAIRHSLRNGSTAYGALSPEYRAFLPPSSREYGFVHPVGLATPPRDLTPTSEASGPHAFAVRSNPSSPKGSTGSGAVRPARRKIAHEKLALRLRARRRCRVHRISSRVRDDRDTPLLPGKDGASL